MNIGGIFTRYKQAYLRELDNVARLEARIEFLEEERRAIADKLHAEHAAHIETHRRFTDFLGKRSGVGTVFGSYESVPEIPPVEMPEIRSTMTGREYVNRKSAEFIEQLERTIRESTVGAHE